MPAYELVISGIVALLFTLIFTPMWISHAKKRKLVGADMNKKDRPKVAESGGVSVFLGFIVGLLVLFGFYLFQGRFDRLIYIALAIISLSIVTGIAFWDDITGWKKGIARWKKPILTFIGALPLIPFLLGRTSFSVVGYTMELPLYFYPLLLVPIGFILASNVVNLLGGFNGLETGMGVICGLTLLWFSYGTPFFAIILVALASMLAFLWFNKYPSRAFPGDTMTYFLGCLFAFVAVMGHFQSITILILMPYVIEGLIKSREILYIFKHKKNFKPECFGKVNKDGTLDPPYGKHIWSITHIAIMAIKKIKGKCYENDVTFLIIGAQALWCLFIIYMFG
jgi:UDP-N-acetylglucosamine--dolichyl-phosphate N-acetylglucosaminephosphotransferase